MRKFRFRQFKIYRDVRGFRLSLRNLIKERFPREELYSLTSQTCRAIDSIILNIAEGADRGTDKDFAHYLNNAHTSLNEVVACLDLALDSQYITSEEHVVYLNKSEDMANQLTAFRRKLLKEPTK